MAVIIKTVVKKGELKWNLPPIIRPIAYRAGQTLHIEITVTNPQDADQEYLLGMSLADPRTGAILLVDNTKQSCVLKIDLNARTFTLTEAEGTIFKLTAKESLTITGDVTFGLTNCILGLFLVTIKTVDTEKEIDELVAALYALLREVPIIDITQLMPPLITIAMIGMMIPMMEKALKRIE